MKRLINYKSFIKESSFDDFMKIFSDRKKKEEQTPILTYGKDLPDTNYEKYLPEVFKITDDGAGKVWHKGIKYLAEPGKFIVIDDKGVEVCVYYNSDYKPIRLTRKLPGSPVEDQDLKRGLAFFFLDTTVKCDPRYIIKNFKKTNLKDIGFEGWGYITETTKNPFNLKMNIYQIVQFISPTQFKSFMFGNGKIMSTQNWTYTIEKIN